MDRFAAYPLLCRNGVRRTSALALTVSAAVVVAGCGSPPRPLPTAPPRTATSLSAPPSMPGVPGTVPPGGLPPITALPTDILPPTGLPTYVPPTVPTPTRTTTPPPPPAPRCTAGPTEAQALAVVQGRPGVPTGQNLKVGEGPFCAGGWQYFTVELAAEPNSEPLLVVTRGRPAELTVVEAGTDVCSDQVRSGAPVGIRVLACGDN